MSDENIQQSATRFSKIKNNNDIDETTTKMTTLSTNGSCSSTLLTLISCDDREYQISKAAAIHSVLIKDSLGLDDDSSHTDDLDDDDCYDNDESNNFVKEQQQQQSKYEPLNVLRVKGKCLEKVVEFLTHYSIEPMDDIPRLLDGNSFEEVVRQEWYREFITKCLNEPIDENNNNVNSVDCTTNRDSSNTVDDTTTATATSAEETFPAIASNASNTTSNSVYGMGINHSIHHQYLNSNNLRISTSNAATNATAMVNSIGVDDSSFPPNRKRLIELLAAANYMTIKPLLDLICLWVTFQLQGKSSEQVRNNTVTATCHIKLQRIAHSISLWILLGGKVCIVLFWRYDCFLYHFHPYLFFLYSHLF
jgi:hypothetical protein